MNVIDFIESIGASLLASATYAVAERSARLGMPIPLALHRRELRSMLRSMPFIYKDIESAVTVDFVDFDIEALDANRLSTTESLTSRAAAERRLQVRTKLLILGNAGIGKSTYVRRTILDILAGRFPPFLFEGERPVPLFVPLKAIDNYAPAPVLRYLFENNIFLRGQHGIRRLRRLAEQRRVILFLDGYDEISRDLGHQRQQNFVRDELNVLIGKHPASALRAPHELLPLYKPFMDCRVWLTSRKEFYAQNPLSLTRVLGASAELLDCAVFGLLGVGNARAQLVKNIFDKYRSHAHKYAELLSEELFLQEVDRAANEELTRLSINPLFLTVMAYVYVHQVLESESSTIQWTSEDAAALVVRCMDLLLRDLDEDKARGLPASQRVALIRRRNAFEAEKRAFLPYFAWSVLDERRNVFDVDFVNRKARDFFLGSTFVGKDAIIRTIDRDPAASDSIGYQLANQGIFVLVGRAGAITRYDFAHQRFKEVLAAKYVEEKLSIDEVLALIEREDLAEFSYVLARQTQLGAEIFKYVLSRASQPDRAAYFGRMASELLRLMPDREVPNAAAVFLSQAVTRDSDILVTREFLKTASPTSELLSSAAAGVTHGIEDRNRRRFTLGATILEAHAPLQLVDLLSANFERVVEIPELSLDAMALLYPRRPDILFAHLELLARSPRTFAEFAYTFATETSTGDQLPESARAALEGLSPRDVAILFSGVEFTNPPLFTALGKIQWEHEITEAILHIVRFARSAPEYWTRIASLGRRMLVVTKLSCRRSNFAEDERPPYIGGVFVERRPEDTVEILPLPRRTDAMTVIAPSEVTAIGRGIAIETEARREGQAPRRRDLHFVLKSEGRANSS
jgi:hypothetical protein